MVVEIIVCFLLVLLIVLVTWAAVEINKQINKMEDE